MEDRRLEYFRLQESLFKIVGLCCAQNESTLSKIMNFLLQVVVFLFALFRFIGEILDFKVHQHQLDIWSQFFSLGSYNAFCIIRLIVVCYKRHDLWDILYDWEKHFARDRHMKNREELLQRWSRKINAWTIFCLVFSMAVCVHWLINPILMAFMFPEVWKRKFPSEVWYPVDVYATPTYELIYFSQCVANTSIIYVGVFCGTYMVNMCLLVHYQAMELKSRLRRIGERVRFGVKIDDERPEIHSDLLEAEIEWCIHYHRTILGFIQQFRSVASPLIAVEVLAIAVPLCFTAFEVSSVATNSSKLLTWMEFFLACVVQLFAYCWSGNELMCQLASIQSAASEALCGDLTDEMRWSLKFMMLQSSNQLKLKGGLFFTLTLETYKRILGLSLSGFIVLRQLKESKINN